MYKISSNTLVMNGMPFIIPVLEQAEPYLHKMYITLSKKCSDGTSEAVLEFQKKHPDKVEIEYEDVPSKDHLTHERQKQADKTEGDWILFLDDDDYWTDETLGGCIKLLRDDIDGLAVSQYRLITPETHDPGWNGKYFTKFFKNKNVTYRKPWPRDMVYLGDKPLYWKHNKEVITTEIRPYHLDLLKGYSFRRKEKNYLKYENKPSKSARLDKPIPDSLRKLIC